MRALNVLTCLCFIGLTCLLALAFCAPFGWIEVPSWLSGMFRLSGGKCYDSQCEQWYEMNAWGKILCGAFIGELVFRLTLDLSTHRGR